MGKSSKRGAAAPAEVIALPADCRVGEAAALREHLLLALEHASVVLDATAVRRWDSAAMQVLLAFRRDAAARGGALAWCGVDENFREAADLLGLAAILELPAVAPV